MKRTPIRIQLSRKKGWRMPPNSVCVARPSEWGNPWRIGRDGDATYCVEQYRRLLIGQPVDAWPNDEFDQHRAIHMGSGGIARVFLAGKNLACWCRLDQPCHADVLLRLANTEKR
ncbi:MAG: DUF4326 domain-containing protein [Rhodanobacter sp.]